MRHRILAAPLALLLGLLLGLLLSVPMVLVAGPTAYASVVALPVDVDLDYQLGGDAAVPGHVGIVERDRESAPLPGKYDICYVNGFQTQGVEHAFWKRHLSLVLQQHGRPVRDQAWNEWLLDISTPAKRAALARIVGGWVTGCATKGYQAVEFDNLDSFTRSHGLLTRADAKAYAARLVALAHAAGLAAGQKNLANFDGTKVGYDFAIAEECGRYHECGDYLAHYGDAVLAVEYRAVDFEATCAAYGDRIAVELRDRDLTPGGVHRWC